MAHAKGISFVHSGAVEKSKWFLRHENEIWDFLKSSCSQCRTLILFVCFPGYYSAKKQVRRNVQAAAKKSTSWKQEEIGNICQASSAFKNWVCRLWTLRGIPQRCFPDSRSDNRKYTHCHGVRPNQLESLWWEIVCLNRTLQKLAKTTRLTCIKNHCAWEGGTQSKQLCVCVIMCLDKSLYSWALSYCHTFTYPLFWI